MKGVVFTELLSFVEEKHSPEFLQKTINAADVASGGVYASAGAYPCGEMAALFSAYARESGDDAAQLEIEFGQQLFAILMARFPMLCPKTDSAFDFLALVHEKIHRDVHTIYPDATPPSLTVISQSATMLRLIYKSSRGLEDLCEGMIRGCLDHFGEAATIERRVISAKPIPMIEFRLTKADA